MTTDVIIVAIHKHIIENKVEANLVASLSQHTTHMFNAIPRVFSYQIEILSVRYILSAPSTSSTSNYLTFDSSYSQTPVDKTQVGYLVFTLYSTNGCQKPLITTVINM